MSSQTKNLKSQIIKEKIKRLGVLFFSLFLTLAVFSQISYGNANPEDSKKCDSFVENCKLKIENSASPSDWLYYKSSNDLSAYLGKKSSSLPTVRYQKGNDYLEFSMTGVSSTTSVSLETNVKTPNTPTLFYRNILDGADANYQITNIPFRVKEEIILKEKISNDEFLISNKIQNSNDSIGNSSINSLIRNSDLEIRNSNLTFLFSAETTAKPVKQDDGSIAFFDNQNNYLFQLDKPFMVDAKGNRSEAVTIEIISKSEVLISNQISNPNDQTNQNRHPMSVLGQTFDDNNQLFKQFKKFFPAWDFKNWNLLRNYDLEIRNFSNIRQNRLTMSVLGPQQYTLTLKADSEWLSQATYPVIIDPTVTHNADANFTGQMNRIADSDTTSSTQLESSYPEATKDPYTVLLLHFNEANGTQTGIRDYASSTRVITANANASTTNYATQLGMGNSAAFDGTGDYLSVPDSEDWNFGGGNFTIDLWARLSANTESDFYVQTAGGAGRIAFYYEQATGQIFFVGNNGSNMAYYRFAWTPTLNQWYHLALVRNGTNIYIFVDGVSQTLTVDDAINSESLPDLSASLTIGSHVTYGSVNGYLDEVRITKGRALTPEEIKASASRRPYSVYTSPVLDASASVQWDTVNWTEGGVKTGDGETPYSTNSLVAQWNFNETSGTTATSSTSGSCQTCAGTLNGFSYTASQDQATTTTGWTANNKKWGAGALMFDGSNDYVSVGASGSTNLNFSGAATLEFWVKTNSDTCQAAYSLSDGTGNNRIPIFFGNGCTGYVDNELISTSKAKDSVNVYSTAYQTTNRKELIDGNWHHVAIIWDTIKTRIYLDGIERATNVYLGTDDGSYGGITGANLTELGRSLSASFVNGIIDSTRIYSRALSASEILSNYNAGNIEIQTRTGATSDPNDGTWEAWKPTTGETQLLSMDSDKGNWNAPEQIDGYTKLLLHMDGTDAATTFPNSATTTHTVTATDNAQVDTAQSKFSGASALFDGTGDYLSVPDNADWALGGTFTVDTWVRFNTIVNNVWIVGQGDGVVGENFWTFYYGVTTLNFLVVQNSSTIISISNSWTPVVNRWYHVAVIDNGGTWKLFVDGVQLGTDGSDADTVHDISSSMFVGADVNSATKLNGWLDELRISKGVARWTSNFTPPPRAYGSNVKASSEDVIKMEGASSTKFMIGAPQIDGNTVALWHMEETGTTTGMTLYDETVNNKDLTTSGTLPTDGIFGKARWFDGVDDNVSISATGFPSGSAARTAMFWAKPEGNCPADSACYVFEYGSSGAHGQMWGASITGTSDVWHFQGYGVGDVDSTASVRYGEWQHVAITYDGSDIKIYFNGLLNTTAARTLNTVLGTFYIGESAIYPTFQFQGAIDELAIYNRVLSADEIAETYRMGANHHLTRQVSAVDLSSANKLAFNVASDRTGTYLEAMLGESDYANYELASSTLALSTNTVLYIKGDEIASSTSIKDSSFSGKAITANGNARTAGNGKIGNAVYFDGTGDYLEIANDGSLPLGSTARSFDMWIYTESSTSWGNTKGIFEYGTTVDLNRFGLRMNTYPNMLFYTNGNDLNFDTGLSQTGWFHLAIVYDGNTTVDFYINGVKKASKTLSGVLNTQSTILAIGNGRNDSTTNYYLGNLDEFRIIKGTALTPDQIRQAYEYGLRTHPITIDFGATLQTSDLISNSTDYNFNITATTSGLSATTSGLYLGDKIIIKENLGGTEYSAQGTVNAINTTTGAITVPSWDTGSTFPASNGYSPNATVFKWQREYFDLTGAATTTRNAITNLTLRPTNGAEGRTIYLDDFRYNTNYLTASSSSAITSSNNRYLQYRAIFSSTDTFVSPFLSALNTLYTSLATMFPPAIGISGGGFLSF